jgi:hypothetical protein
MSSVSPDNASSPSLRLQKNPVRAKGPQNFRGEIFQGEMQVQKIGRQKKTANTGFAVFYQKIFDN